jgi:acyl-coenzyme A synthetase/AMP-(fatty) acid ligase
MSARAFQLLRDRDPGSLVAVGKPGERTVRDLLDDGARIRAALEPARPGQELLLTCGDRYLFAAAALAAWDAGYAVALPPNLRPGSIRSLLETGTVRDMLTEGGAGIDVTALLEGPVPSTPVGTELAADRHVATVHTSGSTGEHRGARKSAAQLLGEAAALVEAFGLERTGPFLATVPPHHIYGLLFGVLAPLTAGVPFLRAGGLHAETIAAVVQEHAARVLVSTPAHLRGLAVLAPGSLEGLDIVFSSGAALHPETGHMLHERFGLEVTEVLGSTETGGIGWRRSTGGVVAPTWRPLPGVQVGVDPEGRLLLDSPFLAEDDPRPRPCDDRIELGEDGRFEHLGRLDDVVKIAGKRLSLRDLERRVLGLPGVEDAAILAEDAPDGRGARVRVAVVGPGTTADAVREGLLAHFDPTVLPRKILMLSFLPREATGKLARARLRVLFEPPVMQAEVLESQRPSDAELVARLRIPRNIFYFRGHFPLEPVFPGVAQLEAVVLHHVRTLWPDLVSLRKVRRLKFKQKIGPDDELVLTLRRKAQDVSFKLARDGATCSEGVLVFAPPVTSV